MNVQSTTFLRQTLSKLLPEVFLHPVWIQFTRNIPTTPPSSIQSLLDDLQHETADDPATQCQILFMCAYLQSYLGEHAEAAISLNIVLHVAETHNLPHPALCAAWGTCAIYVRLGNTRLALEWLDKLQEKVKENREWVLFSILELFRQSMDTQVDSLGSELMDWLFCWGELHLSKKTQAHKHVGTSFVGRITDAIFQLFRSRKSMQVPNATTIENELLSKITDHNGRLIPNTRNGLSNSRSKNFKLHRRGFSTTSFLPEKRESSFLTFDTSTTFPKSDSPALFSSIPTLPEQTTLAVYCLGKFVVYQGEQQVENWSSRKGLSVFKYLVLEHPTPVVKEILMDKFWPDSDLEAARRNLHQAIYSLRQTFRGENQEFQHIWFKNDCYSLNPNFEIWIDFQEFVKSIDDGRRLDKAGHFEEAIEQYGIAEGLYKGDFLEEDLYEEWTVPNRDQFLNRYLGVVDRLCELYLEKRQYTTVNHLCHKLLAKDGCHESAHRMLMQCYLAQGQRNLAVRQYQTCVRTLKQELDISPSEETIGLYKRIASRQVI